jgi:hypothetical protein
MQLKPQPAWSGCWIALVILDQPGWDSLYLNCKGSISNVQNPFDTPGFLRKIWVSEFSTSEATGFCVSRRVTWTVYDGI